MKKAVVAALALISLMTLGVVCFLPVKAQSQSNITINADGSISPSTVPIQQAGNVYSLTSNVDGSITDQRNNTVLDGAGHTLFGLSLKECGLSLNDVSNVTLKNFIVTQGDEWAGAFIGILLINTSNVIVTNNTITGIGSPLALNEETYIGIDVEGGNYNVFAGNDIVNNIAGIYFAYSSNNLIDGNNITETTNPWGACASPGGINFDHGANNVIYHNNFIIGFDAGEAGVSDSVNVWDDGFLGGGNYWSDYQTKYPSATEIDRSGIGNTAYVLDGQNMDRYPLLEPFTDAYLLNYVQEIVPPKVSVLSPLHQAYSNSNVSLVFNVDKSINWAGYSLDGKQNVTITGNSTITNMTYGLHSIAVYVNDTFGILGASQTINFTLAKLEPFPTVPIAAVSGAVAAVVVAAGLLVYFKKRKGGQKT